MEKRLTDHFHINTSIASVFYGKLSPSRYCYSQTNLHVTVKLDHYISQACKFSTYVKLSLALINQIVYKKINLQYIAQSPE